MPYTVCVLHLIIFRYVLLDDMETSMFYEDGFGFIKANPSYKIVGPLPTGYKILLDKTTEYSQPSYLRKEKRSIRNGISNLMSINEGKDEAFRQMKNNMLTDDDEHLNAKLETPNTLMTRIPLIYNEINVS